MNEIYIGYFPIMKLIPYLYTHHDPCDKSVPHFFMCLYIFFGNPIWH